MTDIERIAAELDGLRKELRDTKEELLQAKQGYQESKSALDRYDDYRKIMNAMMGHAYGYEGHAQQYELDRFWSKTMPDISYNDHYGQEGVRRYYAENTASIRANQREIVRRVYGADIPDDTNVGYHVMNMVCSPFIEIAGDGKTAQGVWMEFSFKTHLDEDGKPATSVGTSKCVTDFVKEDGEWKIWRAAYGVGGGFSLGSIIKEAIESNEKAEAPKMAMPYPPFTEEQKKAYGVRKRVGMGLGFDSGGPGKPGEEPGKEPGEKPGNAPGGPGGFAPWGQAVTFSPKLPEPYMTWNPEQACVHFEDDE